MSAKTKKRTTLVRYWTTRYLITLVTGLMVLSIFSAWWMEHTALQYRLSLLKYLADETSDRVIKENGKMVVGPVLSGIVEEREKILHLNKPPIIYITDTQGEIIYTMPQLYIAKGDDHLPKIIINSKEPIQKVKIRNENQVYVVKSAIDRNGKKYGWVVIAQEESTLKELNQDHGLLAVMMGGLLILGWGVIYVLSRRISKPIQKVANAAVQIRQGNYDIQLKEEEPKEEEIHELIESFKEMTNRLKQNDKLRAELFAGVTHDLKTPVTSISGLIQAVKDEVVTGEESKEFLTISLKETQRLQTMIEDLLDYNAMAAGSFKIRFEKENLNKFLQEIAYQWKMTQDDQDFELSVNLPEEIVTAMVDRLRLQEIIINLLNNARQALMQDGKIEISLYSVSKDRVCIDIRDNGRGIPDEEQDFVFEPFYRGEKKKLRVRGLGLGLPFSKMLAKAQKGDLSLKGSSSEGTIFTISLLKSK
ncbi:HAMP domain-containing sensor histidine kinase [Peribacillus sp. B-H-3]|uniref:HAMP domain-containing sensor histidine kinase n=1 Tax=Peribacillus sp. B-H-3 TaxID=3400420 RepID=UPI003B026617